MDDTIISFVSKTSLSLRPSYRDSSVLLSSSSEEDSEVQRSSAHQFPSLGNCFVFSETFEGKDSISVVEKICMASWVGR